MFASCHSAALVGVEALPVRVEVHVVPGKAAFHLVGLPDTAVREAKERVVAAVMSSGLPFPAARLTVNLAPADVPKVGSAYDLPIALGVLAANGDLEVEYSNVVALGELALDGTVRAVRGGLGAALVARAQGVRCLLPPESAREAALVEGAEIAVVRSLTDAIAVARGTRSVEAPPVPRTVRSEPPDLRHVRGQLVARRALEVAAAGGHHLLFIGPPGAGKTMLAQCLPGILPQLDRDRSLETAQAWAAAGRSRTDHDVPPFRSPHHSATRAAVVGGGSGVPVPGELTLAHHGVLFLDELGEFPASILNSLRQPIEEGAVHVARKGSSVTFPCDIQLVAASNPCPCGYCSDRLRSCTCTPRSIDRYRANLSGPLLDRFDLRVTLDRLDGAELVGAPGESSHEVRGRVSAARRRQTARGALNGRLTRRELDLVEWKPRASSLLERAVSRFGVTGRGWDRIRRVSLTIADLDGSDRVDRQHVAEALAFRGEW